MPLTSPNTSDQDGLLVRDGKPAHELLEELGLTITSEGFLICQSCQSFVTPQFDLHFAQSCRSRVIRTVRPAIVELIRAELAPRIFSLPDILPCQPFRGVRCVWGYKCDHCHYCASSQRGIEVHIQSKHVPLSPTVSSKSFTRCFCQPIGAGKTPFFPVTHRPEDACYEWGFSGVNV